MALILDGTDGITSSGGTNVLQDDAVITANIADGAVVAAKIADGAVSDSKIANGAVTAAKLAAGAVPAPSTADVLSATAGASAGAVGTYGLFRTTVTITPGDTISGSSISFSNAGGSTYGDTTGTWRAMGGAQSGGGVNATFVTVFLRIS